jgi:hypothetical protein
VNKSEDITLKNIILTSALVFLVGCSGKEGATGPTGPAGAPAKSTFQTSFQNGVYPNTSYSGELDTWLNGGAQSTYENASPYLEVNTGATYANYGRVLVRFNLSSLPTNVSVVSAQLWLTTETNTTVGANPVTVGLHNLASDTFPGCYWLAGATWNNTGSIGWNNCTGDLSGGQEGYINPTTVSTVVFTSSNNGTSQVFKWNIDPGIVQAWVASPSNNGLILKSEGEFGETASGVDFYPYNGTTGNTPLLVVSYQ